MRILPRPFSEFQLSAPVGIAAISLAATFHLAAEPATPAQSPLPHCISAKSPVADLAPAKGDARTDDTDALQTRIDWALEHGAGLDLEPGTYLISRTLRVRQTNGRAALGFEITGLAGPNRDGDPARGGVCIILSKTASDQPAIMELGEGGFRDMKISNLSLISNVPDAATPTGLDMVETGFSHLVLSSVHVRNVDTAFKVSEGHARNGEAFDLYECDGSRCRRFYVNSAGQAFLHRMFGCSGDLLNGGTFVTIGGEHLGFNLDVFGASVSFAHGPKQNTFVRNTGISGCVGVWGGRVEICDTLLNYSGGSFTCSGIVTMRGIEFTDYSGQYPLIQAANVSNAQYTNLFENCVIDGVPNTYPQVKFGAQPQGDRSRNTFQSCVFRAVSGVPSAKEAQDMRALLRDCRADGLKDPALHEVNMGDQAGARSGN